MRGYKSMFHVEHEIVSEAVRVDVPRGTSDLLRHDNGELGESLSFFPGAFDGNSAFVHGFDCFIHGIEEKTRVFDAKFHFWLVFAQFFNGFFEGFPRNALFYGSVDLLFEARRQVF